MKIRLKILASIFMLAPCVSLAQSAKVDHMTREQMMAKAQELSPKANGADGLASMKLNDYPNHYTMMALRKKDGAVELHEDFADVFFVLKGHATLLSGGKLIGPNTVSAGELRGKSLEGGTREELKPGDVVHIPAAIPHQLLVSTGVTFAYFVVKVKEK